KKRLKDMGDKKKLSLEDPWEFDTSPTQNVTPQANSPPAQPKEEFHPQFTQED
uniref:Uncharacterized protein n=1 Tax=Panagrolaimus sp. JU765 TaxID=591449 RepID=A0AC34Q0N7_9BILA